MPGVRGHAGLNLNIADVWGNALADRDVSIRADAKLGLRWRTSASWGDFGQKFMVPVREG